MKGKTEDDHEQVRREPADLLFRTARIPRAHGRDDERARGSRSASILLVEQKLTIALKIPHRLYVMGHGWIVFAGSPADLMANTAIRKEWLEVRGAYFE